MQAPDETKDQMAETKDQIHDLTGQQPIEKLAAAEQTPAYTLAAVKAMSGWGQGKELTLTAYQEAVAKFLKGPMTGGNDNG